MRRLFINGLQCDLSEDTAIGYDILNGDFSNATVKKMNVTNTFKLSLTARNVRNFKFINSNSIVSDLPYSSVSVDLWESNIRLIKDGKGVIDEVDDGINLTIVFGGTAIDSLKNKTFRQLLIDSWDDGGNSWATLDGLMDFLQSDNSLGLNYPYGKTGAPHTGNYGYNIGAQITIRPLKVLEWIEDFLGYTIIKAGTITDLTILEKMNIPFYDLIPFKNDDLSLDYQLYLHSELEPLYLNDFTYYWGFPTVNSLYDNFQVGYEYYGDKTVLDFLKMLATMFNAYIDVDDEKKEILIIPFNNVVDSTSVKDWSKKLMSSSKSFSVGDYQQNTFIDYKLDESLSIGVGRTTVVCSNVNLKTNSEPLVLDCMIPRALDGQFFYGSTRQGAYDLYMTDKPLTEFIIGVDDEMTSSSVQMACFRYYSSAVFIDSISRPIMKQTWYDFSLNYTGLELVLDNPITFNAVFNLNILDLHNFSPLNLVRVDQLGGVFYINKITGFNLKSRKGTKVELIKIR